MPPFWRIFSFSMKFKLRNYLMSVHFFSFHSLWCAFFIETILKLIYHLDNIFILLKSCKTCFVGFIDTSSGKVGHYYLEHNILLNDWILLCIYAYIYIHTRISNTFVNLLLVSCHKFFLLVIIIEHLDYCRIFKFMLDYFLKINF